jgi:hypothetical protein
MFNVRMQIFFENRQVWRHVLKYKDGALKFSFQRPSFLLFEGTSYVVYIHDTLQTHKDKNICCQKTSEF